MNKPASLRAALAAALPELAANPDKLLVVVERGSVQSTLQPNLSFSYSYTLALLIEEFAGDPDSVFLPLLIWCRANQPELLDNPDLRETGIQFDIDILNNQSVDIAIKLKLSERVIVRSEAGQLYADHPPEPVIDYNDQFASGQHWQLHVHGELVAEWDSP